MYLAPFHLEREANFPLSGSGDDKALIRQRDVKRLGCIWECLITHALSNSEVRVCSASPWLHLHPQLMWLLVPTAPLAAAVITFLWQNNTDGLTDTIINDRKIWSQQGAINLNGRCGLESVLEKFSGADGIPIHLSRLNPSSASPESFHCLLLPIHPLHYSMRPPIMGVCLMKHLNRLESIANLGRVFGMMRDPTWPSSMNNWHLHLPS